MSYNNKKRKEIYYKLIQIMNLNSRRKMQLFSVSRRKKQGYVHGAAHKVYDNRLKQNFHAKKRNRKWCTDFTYLTLADGRKCYNCTIIDLYDRSVIASITDWNITSDLAKRTLEKAIQSQSGIDLKQLIFQTPKLIKYEVAYYKDIYHKKGIKEFVETLNF